MNIRKYHSTAATILILGLLFTHSGCATMSGDELAEKGYRGDAQIKTGIRFIPLDWLGNLTGVVNKIIIFNWRVNRHRITEDTREAVRAYLNAHPELGDINVQLNRWAPVDAMKRLFTNQRVGWPYRFTIGFFSTLIYDVVWPQRLMGADRYNPFTHEVYLYSDLPSIALHELGHAKDFAWRRHKGSYAMSRLVPFVDLYQEYKATGEAISFAQKTGHLEQELECYKVLYPAYGTYVGGYFFGFGSVAGALFGHIIGRAEAHHVSQSRRRSEILKTTMYDEKPAVTEIRADQFEAGIPEARSVEQKPDVLSQDSGAISPRRESVEPAEDDGIARTESAFEKTRAGFRKPSHKFRSVKITPIALPAKTAV